jgi:hypothetical protein
MLVTKIMPGDGRCSAWAFHAFLCPLKKEVCNMNKWTKKKKEVCKKLFPVQIGDANLGCSCLQLWPQRPEVSILASFFFLFFCGTWTQGFEFAKQILEKQALLTTWITPPVSLILLWSGQWGLRSVVQKCLGSQDIFFFKERNQFYEIPKHIMKSYYLKQCGVGTGAKAQRTGLASEGKSVRYKDSISSQ